MAAKSRKVGRVAEPSVSPATTISVQGFASSNSAGRRMDKSPTTIGVKKRAARTWAQKLELSGGDAKSLGRLVQSRSEFKDPVACEVRLTGKSSGGLGSDQRGI